MECNQVRNQLKAFLADLLSEEDTRLFLRHLDACPRCKPYVRSIGELSNQVWKLGNITVPADFLGTVLFKLSRPEAPAPQDIPKSSAGIPKKYLLGGLLLVLALSGFFIKAFFLKSPEPAAIPQETPVIRMERIEIEAEEETEENPEDKESSVQITTTFETSGGTAPPEDSAGPGPSFEKPAARVPDLPAPQHWHLTYFSEDGYREEAEKRKQGLLTLQALLEKTEALKAEISRLEEENEPKLGQSYSDDDKINNDSEKAERDAVLNTVTSQMLQLNDQIEQIREANLEFEREWSKKSAEKKRRETQVKAKILDTLVLFDAKFQYRDENFFVFTVPSEKWGEVLENILPLFQQLGKFQDFGRGPVLSSSGEARVSLYLEQSGSSGLHWHSGALSSAQKEKLFDAVRELGGSRDYESDEIAVLSVPKTRIPDLEVRMKALRIPVSESGHVETSGAPLSSAPVKISISFSN